MNLTVYVAKSFFKHKGFNFFDKNLPYNLNIIGIRSNRNLKSTNKFDDTMLVIYRDQDLDWVVKSFALTTDPGQGTLDNMVNAKGTAILVPGQYPGAYRIAKHAASRKSGHEALCQRKPVRVFRDANKDKVLNLDPETIEEGLFGINIHRASINKENTLINNWSAGCQVLQRWQDLHQLLRLCKNATKKGRGSSFTYTLIEENELIEFLGLREEEMKHTLEEIDIESIPEIAPPSEAEPTIQVVERGIPSEAAPEIGKKKKVQKTKKKEKKKKVTKEHKSKPKESKTKKSKKKLKKSKKK